MNTERTVIEEFGYEESMAALRTGLGALHRASHSQLRASLLGLAEILIERTILCSERTKEALVMEIVSKTLADNENPEIEPHITFH